MHDAGVTDFVIDAMQTAPIGNSVVVAQPTNPVVVREEIHTTPVYVTRPTYSPAPTYYQSAPTRPSYLQANPSYRRNF